MPTVRIERRVGWQVNQPGFTVRQFVVQQRHPVDAPELRNRDERGAEDRRPDGKLDQAPGHQREADDAKEDQPLQNNAHPRRHT